MTLTDKRASNRPTGASGRPTITVSWRTLLNWKFVFFASLTLVALGLFVYAKATGVGGGTGAATTSGRPSLTAVQGTICYLHDGGSDYQTIVSRVQTEMPNVPNAAALITATLPTCDDPPILPGGAYPCDTSGPVDLNIGCGRIYGPPRGQ
jgi:hypothetical protein